MRIAAYSTVIWILSITALGFIFGILHGGHAWQGIPMLFTFYSLFVGVLLNILLAIFGYHKLGGFGASLVLVLAAFWLSVLVFLQLASNLNFTFIVIGSVMSLMSGIYITFVYRWLYASYKT